MKNTINQRVKELIKVKAFDRKADFEKMIGAKNNTIRSIVGTQGSKPSYPLIESILESFPDVSAEWLIKGKGDMIIKEKIEKDVSFYKSILNTLERELERYQKREDLYLSQLEANLGKYKGIVKGQTRRWRRCAAASLRSVRNLVRKIRWLPI